ncbi:glycosyltransferase [Halarcobacter sp.]|uniref:glycosyltransferase n=1 Tax=Halarcobacter sp. TaxID=2321133 RepID=UPI003A9145CD
MEDLNNIAEEVITLAINNIENKDFEDEVIVGLYYICKYIENGHSLSSENIILLKKAISLLSDNLKDIRFAIVLYLLQTIEAQKETKEIKSKFFESYYNFDNFQNILDNKDFILLIFPQEKLEEYLECFNLEFLNDKSFWNKTATEKQQVIFKFHYITMLIYEKNKESFHKMFDYLFKIFETAIEKKDDELVFYLYTPLLFSYNGVSTSFEECSYFNNLVEKKLESYIKNHLIQKYEIKPNRKKSNNKKLKIAFIQERLIEYSIYQVLYRLLKSLVNTEVEIIVLDLNFKELGGSFPEKQNELKLLGCKVIDCNKEFAQNDSVFYSTVQKSLKLREYIIAEDIDVLIGMNARPEYNFLFTTRTAPLQIYWSHGNHAYNIEEIDKKITHCIFEKELDFEQITIPLDKKNNSSFDNIKIKEIRECFPLNTFILGSIGRLVKIDNYDYLETVAKIMKDNPNTIFIACGSGDQKGIQEKIEELGIKDRFYFVGYVDPHLYGSVIDLYLDSFPFRGGESFQEYIYKIKPFICLVKAPNKEWIDKQESSFRKYLYPYSKTKYIEYANAMIKDKELSSRCMEVLEKELKTNEKNFINIFLNIIKKGTDG